MGEARIFLNAKQAAARRGASEGSVVSRILVGFRGLACRVGFRVQGLGFRGFGFRVGFRDSGVGFRV